MNTLQQVAGAVGTALFVALSAVIATGLSGTGAAAPAADDLIRGYSIAIFTAAGFAVVLIFLTTLLKPQRKKIALQ